MKELNIPTTLKICYIFFFVQGALGMLFSILVWFTVSIPEDAKIFTFIFLILFTILSVEIGKGLKKVKKWAYITAIILSIIEVSLVFTEYEDFSLLTIAWIVVLVLLIQLKKYFWQAKEELQESILTEKIDAIYESSKFLKSQVLDIIITSVKYLTELEDSFYKDFRIDDYETLFYYQSDETNLEKSLFTLAIVWDIYKENGIDKKDFFNLAYSTFDVFSSDQILNKLEKNNDFSKKVFLQDRLNFYWNETNNIKNSQNPHSGKITYYWYWNPLSKEIKEDLNTIALSFFLTNYKKYIDYVNVNVNEVIDRYYTELYVG